MISEKRLKNYISFILAMKVITNEYFVDFVSLASFPKQDMSP